MKRTPERLKEILAKYSDGTKHSAYQLLPDFVVEESGIQVDINTRWRGDESRLKYFYQALDFNGCSLVDIGANTGYLSLSIGYKYDCQVTAYDINPNNVGFINALAEYFGLTNVRAEVLEVSLTNLWRLKAADICLNLNVLHHAGTDFDVQVVEGPDGMESYVSRYLDAVRDRYALHVMQLGYNFGGDKRRPLFGGIYPKRMLAFWVRCAQQSGLVAERFAMPAHVDDRTMVEMNVEEAMRNWPDIPPSWNKEPSVEEAVAGLKCAGMTYGLSEFYMRPVVLLQRPR